MVYRQLQTTTAVDGSQIRSAKFDGIDHMVVPTVALRGNIIVTPMNSKLKEFVPLEELSKVPIQWDNRPILNLHPNNGEQSANTPSILESLSFGRMFNTHMEGRNLETEAWIDTDRANQVGEGPQSVVERLGNNETISVSVGAFVRLEETSGVFNGEHYDVIWRDIRSDHLALLPAGSKGACSIEDGCRANQASEDKDMDKDKGFLANLDEAKRALLSDGVTKLIKTFLGLGSGLASCELNDDDVRNELFRLLDSDEEGFLDVVFVSSASSTVVYVTWLDNIRFFSRTFSVDDADKITLNDDVKEGSLQTKFAPFDDTDSTSDLSAVGNDKSTTDTANNGGGGKDHPAANEGENMCDKAEKLVDRLISNGLVEESDREATVALHDGSDALCEKSEKALSFLSKLEKVVDTDKKEVEQQSKTDAELIAELPEPLRAMVARSQAEESSRRESLVTYLSKAQSEWAEDALNKKSTEDLQSLAKMLGGRENRDYSLQGGPVANAAPTVNEAPKSWSEALEAKQAAN